MSKLAFSGIGLPPIEQRKTNQSSLGELSNLKRLLTLTFQDTTIVSFLGSLQGTCPFITNEVPISNDSLACAG